MTKANVEDLADRLSRRRARVLPFLAILYLSQQFTFFSQPERTSAVIRSVDQLKISAWVVLTLVLMMGLSRFAYPFHGRAVRDLLDDETTRANRREAHSAGFWAMCWSAVALYTYSTIEPLGPRTVLHILLSAGIGVALLRFGRLELEAHRLA
jgi:hypothetical protein